MTLSGTPSLLTETLNKSTQAETSSVGTPLDVVVPRGPFLLGLAFETGPGFIALFPFRPGPTQLLRTCAEYPSLTMLDSAPPTQCRKPRGA